MAFDAKLTEAIGLYNDDEIRVIQNDEMTEPTDQADEDIPTAAPVDEPKETTTNDAVAGLDMLVVRAEIFRPHGDRNEIAKIMGRKRNSDGLYVGRAHNNPILDSRVFTVRFPDGDETDVAYNVTSSQNTCSHKSTRTEINTNFLKKSWDTVKTRERPRRAINTELQMGRQRKRSRQLQVGTWKSNGRTGQPLGCL